MSDNQLVTGSALPWTPRMQLGRHPDPSPAPVCGAPTLKPADHECGGTRGGGCLHPPLPALALLCVSVIIRHLMYAYLGKIVYNEWINKH